MAITGRADIFSRMSEGKGQFVPFATLGVAAGTSAIAASGYLNMRPMFNTVGSSLPGTRVSIPYVSPTNGAFFTYFNASSYYSNSIRAVSYTMGWLYTLGTVNLAATGNQFTEDSGVGPFLRTIMGQASQPITLTPFLYVTTATATTAPILRLRNATGPGNGYYDQDGNYTTGAIDLTFPATATANNSVLYPMLESGDSGVRRITHIDVTTAGTAGAAVVFGFEPIASFSHAAPSIENNGADLVHSGPFIKEATPAVATSGTATVALVALMSGNSNSGNTNYQYATVENS